MSAAYRDIARGDAGHCRRAAALCRPCWRYPVVVGFVVVVHGDHRSRCSFLAKECGVLHPGMLCMTTIYERVIAFICIFYSKGIHNKGILAAYVFTFTQDFKNTIVEWSSF